MAKKDVSEATLGQNPWFLEILDRSRARYAAEGGLTTEEVRQRLNLPAKSRRPRRATKK